MKDSTCPECGASYRAADDSCEARFHALLALDHSRREPWGSRHGQAFAVFVLQHPERYPTSVNRAREALCRIYCQSEPAAQVFASLRRPTSESGTTRALPERPRVPLHAPAVTIADLGDFPPASYPAQLDAWCRATLMAWGVDTAPGCDP